MMNVVKILLELNGKVFIITININNNNIIIINN